MIPNVKWLSVLVLIILFLSVFTGFFSQNGRLIQSEVAFDHLVIDDGGLNDIWLKTVGDINGDGQIDLVAGGNASGGLAWYESPDWVKHTIDATEVFRTDGEVVDVDRDGDQDVITLSATEIRWYENPTWTIHSIGPGSLHDLEVSDFDQDGDIDLVARNQSEFAHVGNELYFYRQDTPFSWTYRMVNCPDGEGLKLTDVDRDGDEDVIVNGSWLENTNDILNGDWKSYKYTTSWTNPNTFINTGDVNGDQRVDIVLAPAELEGDRYHISWFQAPTDPKSSTWEEHIVDSDVEAVHHFIGVADMDNDGDQDIASAEMVQGDDPDEVKLYLNDDGTGGTWVKNVIATTGSHSMRIVDIGNDGDQDLYGANWRGNQVELWLNQTCRSKLTSWERHVIDPDRPWRAIFIAAGDMDQDGWPDILSGGWWYKNPGNPSDNWTRQAFGNPLHNLAAVQDFDGDGLLDVLGTMGKGSDADPRFVWAHNDGSGSFSILNNIAEGPGDFLQGVAIGQLESGGDLTVGLSWHAPGNGIQLLTVPANPLSESWTIEPLSDESQDEALSMGDIDRDGDQDLLLGTIWLENAGSSWQKHTLHVTDGLPYGESNPDRNRLVDINQDGRLDAVIGYEAISVTGKLAWYEQGEEAKDVWQENVIADVIGPMSLDVVDLDGDGDLDVVVGEHNLDDPNSAKLLIFENINHDANQWQEHVVYQGDEHHDGAQVVDIDLDGDLDILSIGWNHSQVLLYENKGIDCTSQPPGTSTPFNTPPFVTSEPTNPSPEPTPAGTGTPVPPVEPGNCLFGLLIPLGLLLTAAKTIKQYQNNKDSKD